jgi:rhodanese-related sulfurtransferase
MSESAVGRLSPPEAAAFLETHPQAVILDVRSKVEFDYVGHPIGAVHVAWKEFPHWQINTQFTRQVRERLAGRAAGAPEQIPVLVICRSGARSLAAGEQLSRDGFREVYNIEEGFEGERDARNQRGHLNGWRYHGLPWEQT